MVSYVLQGVVTAVLGPVPVLVALLKWNRQWPFYEAHERGSRIPGIIRELAIHSLKVNFINAMAVNFTIAVRRTAKAPFLEAGFGGALAMYQVWICLVSLISWHSYFEAHYFSPLASHRFFHAIWFFVIMVCFLVTFFAKDDTGSGLRGDVATQCEVQRGFPRPEGVRQREVLIMAGLAVVTFPIFIFFWIICPFRRVNDSSRAIVGSRRVVGMVYAAYLTAALSCAIIILLRSMFHTRAQAKTFSKDAYEDDNWGFGQVMAVVLWLGFLSDSICIIRGKELYVYLLYVVISNQDRCRDLHTLETPPTPGTDVYSNSNGRPSATPAQQSAGGV